MTTINITAHTDDASQIDALKAFMKALKIKFEVKKEESPYDPDFAKTVLKAEKEIKNGKGKKISSDSFDNLWK
jgi:hypothetical protein